MIRKLFKVLFIVIGAIVILFGLVGGIIEISSDEVDITGLILAPVFIVLGAALLYLGMRKKKATLPRTILPETTRPPTTTLAVNPEKVHTPDIPETVKEKLPEQTSDGSMWQRKFLVVSGSIELFLMTSAIILAAIIGVAGFIGGEMGTMIGILMFAVVIGIGTVVSMRIVSLWGFVKKNRWAPIVNLILVISLTAIALSLKTWPIIPYFGFTGWCSIYLIKHPFA